MRRNVMNQSPLRSLPIPACAPWRGRRATGSQGASGRRRLQLSRSPSERCSDPVLWHHTLESIHGNAVVHHASTRHQQRPSGRRGRGWRLGNLPRSRLSRLASIAWRANARFPRRAARERWARRPHSKPTRTVGHVHLKAPVSAEGQQAVVEAIAEEGGVLEVGVRQVHDVQTLPTWRGHWPAATRPRQVEDQRYALI